MPYDRPSPLLAMSPLAPSPTSGSGGQAGTPQHQIPFPSSSSGNVQALTFGFGFQPVASTASPSHGTSKTVNHAWGGGSSAPLRRADAKRRRGSASDSESETEGMAARDRSSSPTSASSTTLRSRQQHTSQQTFPKRMRAGIGLMSLDESLTPSPSRTKRQTSPAPPVTPSAASLDVGKMLSTLDKTSLLQVVSRLLASSHDPTLPEQILSHIPAPSISAVEASLDESVRVIRTLCSQAGDMRPEFAWSRLRGPVADFASTAQGFLPFFVASSATGSVSKTREAPHASTTFAFLHLVTSRALQMLAILPDQCAAARIASTNPNAIASQMLPILFAEWTRFVETVSRTVNEEGGMYGGETARSWLAGLDALWRGMATMADPSREMRDEERSARLAIEGVRQQLEARIGWLAHGTTSSHANPFGLTSASTSALGSTFGKRERSASLRMDEEEEL